VNTLPNAGELQARLELLLTEDDGLLLHQELLARMQQRSLAAGGELTGFLRRIQEAFILGARMFIFYRPEISVHRYLRLDSKEKSIVEIQVPEYLRWKERLAAGGDADDTPLCIDFSPFHGRTAGTYSVSAPCVPGPGAIGQGVSSLFSRLAASLKSEPARWSGLLELFRGHRIDGSSLLLRESAPLDREALGRRIDRALHLLEARSEDTPCTAVWPDLEDCGLDPGWGRRVKGIRETLSLFRRSLGNPDERSLEELFHRLPLISKVAILSPHGWFGQRDVLGKPDTGGQVIYILDQVRGLEEELAGQLFSSGVEIKPRIIVLTRLIPNSGNSSCDVPLEKIDRTSDGWILRVPFRYRNGTVVKDWISRFRLWPYLDRFIRDGARELEAAFPGRPDLVIGNYSDGNITAARLAETFDATLCTIAHALEKTKYLRSDIQWRELEDEYHFSIHFNADTLSMERSDFIVTSTFQEIAGTDESIGQYESYRAFTLPGYCRVISGTDIRHWKYNINPPGVDEGIYFPYYQVNSRDANHTEFLYRRLFSDCHGSGETGSLADADKPPLLAMSRLDRIKNISGLVDAYGRSGRLRESTNLIVAGGTTRLEESHDAEERREIETLHRLIDDHELEGSIRWLPSIEKKDTGEVYRIIADKRGAFVQPALFEGFGLTVLEAMASGLPTFATRYGGPSEIIEDGNSGFLIDPHDPDALADVLEGFVHNTRRYSQFWGRISEAGIERVKEYFTWPRYCRRLVTMAKIYGSCRRLNDPHEAEAHGEYWDDLYLTLIRNRAESMERNVR
jgi:sucrose synthase